MFRISFTDSSEDGSEDGGEDGSEDGGEDSGLVNMVKMMKKKIVMNIAKICPI